MAEIITRSSIFCFCLLTALNSWAQVLPLPGAKLSFNQIMFEHEKVPGAALYVVHIEEDTTGADSVDRYSVNCAIEQTDSSTATVIDGLPFGKKYKWMYAGLKPGRQPLWKGPYYFEILLDTLLNNVMGIEVTKNDAGRNAGGLIINDCTHSIVDRNGKLVWYLSNVGWHFKVVKAPITANAMAAAVRGSRLGSNMAKFEVKPVIYDLKMNAYGTITDIEDSFPIERDVNSNVLWQAPDEDKVSGLFSEYYNHDFKRLPNGHYMVLGNVAWRKLPAYKDTAGIKNKYPEIKVFDGLQYARVDLGTIIEFDKDKNVIWSWKCQNYFDSDVLHIPDGSLKFNMELKPHMNAFSVDKNNEFVYAGFRDVSRIIKIEKATGKVVDSWGATSPSGKTMHSVLFHEQHDANILDDGNIAVFNNNDYPGRDSIPSIVVFSQQPGDSGYIVWKYDCDLKPGVRRSRRTGGNVDKLKNGNFLVCLGDVDKILEVTPDKKVVWQADIKPNERRSFDFVHRLYRAHYISSLYPCYFIFETDKDTVHKISAQFNVRLFNKGSESDAYTVKVSSASGALIEQFTTDTLVPGRSISFSVKAGKHIRMHDKIEVSVTSVTNQDFDRKRWVVVR